MSTQRRYGLPVDAEDVSAALETTRLLRLALNVLWDGLPDDVTAGPVHAALTRVHDYINKTESAELRRWGLAEHYLIIRPLSPLNPPPPQDTEKITTAVRTLAELGMLTGQHDALYREDH